MRTTRFFRDPRPPPTDTPITQQAHRGEHSEVDPRQAVIRGEQQLARVWVGVEEPVGEGPRSVTLRPPMKSMVRTVLVV
jgi:hypothetical protein